MTNVKVGFPDGARWEFPLGATESFQGMCDILASWA